MPLSLFLLGPPRVEIDGEAIAFPRQKSLALLVYLAVTGEQQRRDTLAALLWPESADARGSLRRELSSLRAALGNGDWLDADRESVALNGDVWLDVDDFLAAARSDDPARLAQAADLYRQDFLTGFTLADAPDFDDWRFFASEEYRRAFAAALEGLAAHHQNGGDPDAAIPYARRLLALDNLHEPSHRLLMRLYALAGQPSAALRQYDECIRLLDEELGVPPEEETTELHEAIRTRRGGWQVAGDKSRGSGEESPNLQSPISNLHLPTPATSFIGRERELAELAALLSRADVRLAAVVAPGGMGKSRLAIEAARRLARDFPDGVWFASLVGVNESSQMLAALVQLLGAPMGAGDAADALLRFFARRRLLLVLDNFEQLAESAPVLAELLAGGPGVKLLVTSRVRLNLREEWVFPLAGLATADDGRRTTDERAEAGSAIRLFVERARQVQPDFDAAGEAAAVAAICRTVEGMPLAIELAASWLRAMNCAEIAVEIRRDVDFLRTSLRNVPEQHRSMRAVFERSWALLTPDEQRGLARLSVFQGGFTRQAAEAVAEVRLPLLSALVDHSLLRHSASGRYDVHELLRQFAAEQLAKRESVDTVRDRHAAYYLRLLTAYTDDIQWRRPTESVAELLPDRENFFAAWEQAAQGSHFRWIQPATAAFQAFSLHIYAGAVAQERIEALLSQIRDAEGITTDERNDLKGRLLWRLACLDTLHRDTEFHLAQIRGAKACLQASASDNREEIAVVEVYEAMALGTLGKNDEGADCMDRAVAIFSALGNAPRLGWAYTMYCYLELGRGRPAFAHAWHERSMAIWREGGVAGGSFLSQLLLYVMEGEHARMRQAGANALEGLPDPFRFENGTGVGDGMILQILGEWGIFAGELEQAEAYFQQADTVLVQEGQEWHQVMGFRVSLGTLYRLQGKWAAARQQIESRLATIRKIGYQQRIVARLCELACLEHELANYAPADAALSEALEIAESIDFEFFKAQCLCQMGHTAAAQGKPEAANYYRRGLEIAEAQRMNPITLDALRGAAQLRADAGDVTQAVEWLALVASHSNADWETQQKARKALAAAGIKNSGVIPGPGDDAALHNAIAGALAWLRAR